LGQVYAPDFMYPKLGICLNHVMWIHLKDTPLHFWTHVSLFGKWKFNNWEIFLGSFGRRKKNSQIQKCGRQRRQLKAIIPAKSNGGERQYFMVYRDL
jgi:hypothetical protein